MVLRPNFILGPVDLEKIDYDVRQFYKREALLFAKNDEEKAKKLLSGV